MELAKSGNIGKICTPNALATFKEYLNDFASQETKDVSGKFFHNEIERTEETTKKKVLKMVEKVDAGKRDVFM